jgi:hypothetical protein
VDFVLPEPMGEPLPLELKPLFQRDGQRLQIVQGLDLNEFARAKITASVDELKGEKAMAAELGLVK